MRIMFLLGVLGVGVSSSAASDDLSSLVDSVRSQDHSGTLAVIDSMRSKGLMLDGEVAFFEGQSLYYLGEWRKAEQVLLEYLLRSGRSSPRYDAAVWMIARARVELDKVDDVDVAYKASGAEGERIVGKVELVSVDYGYLRIKLYDNDLSLSDLYVKPDEYGTVRYEFIEAKSISEGVFSVVPSGGVAEIMVGQPVYRIEKQRIH